MTHTTEQERAEFEKLWAERPIYMGQDHQKELALHWWQAARRAPAVPVQQGWTDQLEQVLCDLQVGPYPSIALAVKRIEGLLAAAPQPPEAALVPSIAVTPEMVEAANEAYCPFGDMELALCAALQVAPIPPEAAPVQLPEPVAVMTDTTPREPGWKTIFVPDAGTKLYTEQQVRQLLAAHGIKEQQ